jgi:hypothetical protein
MFRGLGFELSDNDKLERGYEKIAIYADAGGVPTHAARQLDSGKWTSKLGRLEDIEHDTLSSLQGPSPPAYGEVRQVLRRRRQAGSVRPWERVAGALRWLLGRRFALSSL